MIYVSSGFFTNESVVQVIKKFISFGLKDIELSGGLYSESLLNDILKLKKKCSFQIHNYFPPPSNPFVFNLGSLDPDIGEISIQHAKQAIKLAASFGQSIYSFHAGFLFDPYPSEIGQIIDKKPLFNISQSTEIFIKRLNILAKFAQKRKVELLIENNVLSFDNYNKFECNPFLMTSIEDTIFIMNNTAPNVNLLIDVGHLKVSSHSLGFDPVEYLEQSDRWIKAYHLSDNDGLSDCNHLINDDSWFWPYIKYDLGYYSLEIKSLSMQVLKQQCEFTRKKIKQ